ncbi:MAG TPA: DNA-3-methyladenine glycosylase I [Balneolales bacterium]|nr:DNA-3-methyladenine glycosylase I [Balneolales bacterium]
MKKRCGWVTDDPLYLDYHDNEWGTPVHDDRKLFEMLILEGVQAGLSWITVLRKREHYLMVFDDFNPEKVASYGQDKIDELLSDPGIIRNKSKVNAAVQNAGAFLKVQEEYGSFDHYIWLHFAGDDGQPAHNHWKNIREVPAQTDTSKEMSKALKKKGFNFVGPTICYSFMQAVGLVNDHTIDCFRYNELT